MFFTGRLGSPWAGRQQSQDLQDQTIHHLNWQLEDRQNFEANELDLMA